MPQKSDGCPCYLSEVDESITLTLLLPVHTSHTLHTHTQFWSYPKFPESVPTSEQAPQIGEPAMAQGFG